MDKEEGKLFFAYLNQKRSEYGVSMGKLCNGVCTPRIISYMEKGERYPELMLRDRLSARLGIDSDDYSQLLDCQEYDQWLARQTVVHQLFRDNMQEAAKALRRYEAGCNQNDPLEKQFCLGMQFQIRRREHADREELAELCGQAVEQTLKGVTMQNLYRKAVSAQELNLLMEKEWYRAEGRRSSFFLAVMEYLEKHHIDETNRVKIYPKAVLYWCRSCMETQPEDPERLQLLESCTQAIEFLRDRGRLYYFWELLELREELLADLTARYPEMESMEQENRQWKELLEELYAEYGVEKRTFHEGFLYVSKHAECVNDVIRIRRKMLGLSQRQLCDGLCDVKTLRRLEHRQTTPQRAIVTQLLIRLGLPGELRYADVLTDNPELTGLLRKMRDANLVCQTKTAEDWWEKVKQELPPMQRLNRQKQLGEETVMAWKCGELQREEYCRRLQEAIELTLPLKAFLQPGEKYLTKGEQDYIRDRMQGLEPSGEEFQTCMQRFEEMCRPYMFNEKIESMIGMFEFIMSYIGSELGNKGQFDDADEYSRFIAEESLRERRFRFLPGAIYDQCWNYAERRKQGISIKAELDTEKELEKFIMLSRMVKNEKKELFYRKKLLEF